MKLRIERLPKTLVDSHHSTRTGEKDYWNRSNWNPSIGLTSYMQQLATAGRRGVAAKLFNVSNCTGSWMYDDKCKLDLDTDALMALIRKWVPRYKHNETNWVPRRRRIRPAQHPAQHKHAQHHENDATRKVHPASIRGFFDWGLPGAARQPTQVGFLMGLKSKE